MKFYKYFAAAAAVCASNETERDETDDMLFTECQAEYLKSEGIQISPKNIVESDCHKEEEGRGANALTSRWIWDTWNGTENKFVIPYYYPDHYKDEEYTLTKNDGFIAGFKHTGLMSMYAIDDDLKHFERLTCIKFKRISESQKDNYEARIRVHWDDKSKECSSGIGYHTGDAVVNMRPDCWSWNSRTTPNHEFMHRLGFSHEHQRADRDKWVKIHPKLRSDHNYEKMEYGEWKDLDSPYDFESIMNYNIGYLKDGLPKIALALFPRLAAPVDRTYPMSKQDAYQINKYHSCTTNNKCADAGPRRCGGLIHRCVNRPQGYYCDCAEGYEKYYPDGSSIESCRDKNECRPDLTSNFYSSYDSSSYDEYTQVVVDVCPGAPCYNHVGGYTCGEPYTVVHDTVMMIDGTGSYATHRRHACQGVVDLIHKARDLHGRTNTRESPKRYRVGVSLYSDRRFSSDEFHHPEVMFKVSMPLQDAHTMTPDEISDVYDTCMLDLSKMYFGGDAPEDVLGGLIWTRSSHFMNWIEDSPNYRSIKSIIVATDVGFWTKENYDDSRAKQGPVTPATEIPSPGFYTLHDLNLPWRYGRQPFGTFSYYPEGPAARFILEGEFKIDHLFVSLIDDDPSIIAQFDGLKRHLTPARQQSIGMMHSKNIEQQFYHIAEAMNDFVATAAASAAAVDECELGTHDCHAEATCADTTEAYTCSCNEGFHGNGFSCTVIDPCETLTCNGPHEFCRNGACDCDKGYIMTDGKCADVDECAIIAATVKVVTLQDSILVPCSAGASCHNTVGSYECICDVEGWEEVDGKCVNMYAWKQVVTQYSIRMHKINGQLSILTENLEKTKFTRRYIRKMVEKIQQLDEFTNDEKYRCDGSDRPEIEDPEADDVMVFEGEDICKQAKQINSALVSASRKWACKRKTADRLVRHFNKYKLQFMKRMCSEE